MCVKNAHTAHKDGAFSLSDAYMWQLGSSSAWRLGAMLMAMQLTMGIGCATLVVLQFPSAEAGISIVIVAILVTLSILGNAKLVSRSEKVEQEILQDSFYANKRAAKDRELYKRTLALLQTTIPSEIATELLHDINTAPRIHKEALVLYFDMQGFTEMVARRSSADTALTMNRVISKMDRHLEGRCLTKVDTSGDSYLVVANVGNLQRQVRLSETIHPENIPTIAALSPSQSLTGTPRGLARSRSPLSVQSHRTTDSHRTSVSRETTNSAGSAEIPGSVRARAGSILQRSSADQAIGDALEFAFLVFDDLDEMYSNGEISDQVTMRAGLDLGEVTTCIAGRTALRFAAFGKPVNMSARMQAAGRPRTVQMPRQVETYIPSRIRALFVLRPSIVAAKGFGNVQTFIIERPIPSSRSLQNMHAGVSESPLPATVQRLRSDGWQRRDSV